MIIFLVPRLQCVYKKNIFFHCSLREKSGGVQLLSLYYIMPIIKGTHAAFETATTLWYVK